MLHAPVELKSSLKMDQQYFMSRVHASLVLAAKATDSRVRLIHLDLAGRYSVAAARDAG